LSVKLADALQDARIRAFKATLEDKCPLHRR
jgi:hypothetical protein